MNELKCFFVHNTFIENSIASRRWICNNNLIIISQKLFNITWFSFNYNEYFQVLFPFSDKFPLNSQYHSFCFLIIYRTLSRIWHDFWSLDFFQLYFFTARHIHVNFLKMTPLYTDPSSIMNINCLISPNQTTSSNRAIK